MVSIIVSPSQRLLSRILLGAVSFYLVKWIFWDAKPKTPPGQIAHPAILERITLSSPLSGQALDTRKYPFLQTRINRDEVPDLFDNDIREGINDFWQRFQKPFATHAETVHLDEQVVRGAVDELLGFNGWAAAACSSLTRPFGAQKREDDWADLAKPGLLYYFALVVHGADHFLIDQLAVIVQLSKRLGPNSVFVSLVDYASSDSTPFICDMAEAVMILLGISFRIRQVPSMTADPTASYYPLEEAYTRNLALEPLVELVERRKVKFHRVIWLKGFTCPNDILETLRVSVANDASMVCSMDWKEHNGFFIYNDRWRTRDMDGNLFRGSKSTSPIDESPPRDAYSGARYNLHLPFQVFCCESGAHIVDPHKSYYEGITYQSSVEGVFNATAAIDGKSPRWSEGPCMDSSQMHFCRDMWMVAFRAGIRDEASRLREVERLGGLRADVDPYMEDLIQAMSASYSPTLSRTIGYPNSGDYLADETGAAPGGGAGRDSGIEATEKMRAAVAAAAAADELEESVEDALAEKEEEQEEERAKEAAAADPREATAEKLVGPTIPEVEPAFEGDEAGGDEQDDPKLIKRRPTNDKEDQPSSPLDQVANLVKRNFFASPPLASQDEGGAESLLTTTRSDDTLTSSERRRLEEEDERSQRTSRSLPNQDFPYGVARILVNPRCVTTYAGVSHTQLARDLFGSGEDKEPTLEGGRYILDEWRTPPESFVCQEMRTTGGRTAAKQQRRTGFQQARLLLNGWRPT